MVTGDDVTTGAAIAKQLGIPGEAILGADFAAMPSPNGWPASTASAWSDASPPSTRCCWPTRSRRSGDVVAMTGDWRERRARRSRPPTSGSRWAAAPTWPRTPSRMILSDDNFADDRLRRSSRVRKLYDNLIEVHPFRPDPAGRLSS
jgi:Ca2+-transporting ATPase